MNTAMRNARAIHERKLVDLVATPEPDDEFDAAMRRGSIEYRKSALRAIDKLTAEESGGVDNCPK